MKKHINMFLVVAIGIAFVILGVISYYYQGTFKEVITNYQSTKTSLKKCTDDVKKIREQYLTVSQAVNTSKEDIAKYGELYEEKTGELDKTKGTLKTAQASLTQMQKSLEETKMLYESEKVHSDSLQTQLKNALDDVADLKSRNSVLKNENAKLSSDLASCRGS